MHGIETGFTGYLGLMEGCSTQTCRYVAKQALLHVAVLYLCCHLPGELWECLTALGQRDKVQDQVSKPFALAPLHVTAVVWQCSGDLSVARWVLEVSSTVLGTDTTVTSEVVVVWFL